MLGILAMSNPINTFISFAREIITTAGFSDDSQNCVTTLPKATK